MDKIITIILTFLGVLCFSQNISGIIISSEDNSPIRFAKIGIEESVIGTLTDENGNFSIDLTGVDRNSKVKVEIAGFENYSATVSTFSPNSLAKIFLSPRIINIEEVFILGGKFIEKNLGSSSKIKKPHIFFIPASSESVVNKLDKEKIVSTQNPEVAIQIDSKKKSKILRINMNFAKFNLNNSVLSRFTIYSEKDGFPNQIINSEDLIFNLKKDDLKDGVFTLDVSQNNIWIENKIFVSYQVLEPHFENEFWICVGFFGKGFLRMYVENWKKISKSIVPAINIDVITEP